MGEIRDHQSFHFIINIKYGHKKVFYLNSLSVTSLIMIATYFLMKVKISPKLNYHSTDSVVVFAISITVNIYIVVL